MKIQQMFYFMSVCEYGGLRRAAEALEISQSTLSAAIKRLEEEFEVQLFNRKHRKMVLTHAGEYYLKECRNLLEEYQKIPRSVQQIISNKAFEMSFSPSLGMKIVHIAAALDTMHDLKKQIKFRELATFPDVKEMIQGEPELYIDYSMSRSEQTSDSICQQILYEDSWALVMSHDHPYAQEIARDKGMVSITNLKQVSEQSFGIYAGEKKLLDEVSSLLPDVEKTAYNQLCTLFSFIAHHRLISILPCSIARSDSQLCYFPLSDVEPIYITVSYSTASPNDMLRDKILTVLKSKYAQALW